MVLGKMKFIFVILGIVLALSLVSATSNQQSHDIREIDDFSLIGRELLLNASLCLNITLNISSDYYQGKVIYTGDLDANNHKLTEVGELIMEGVITSQNITPVTDGLYSLGNSTNWFKDLWVETIYARDINTTNLSATNIDSENIKSVDVNTTNLTIGGFDIYKEGGNLNIDLD